MKTLLDKAAQSVTLVFDDEGALDAFVEKSRARGVKARFEQPIDEGTEFEVVLESPTRSIELATRVRQVYRSGVDGWGTVFEVLDWSPAEGTASGNEAEPVLSETRSEATESQRQRPARDQSTSRASAPVFAIKELNPNERRRLATRANRNERQVLLRDSSPQVLMGLLSNPRIDNKEIIQLIKNPQVSAGILKRIAENRQYTSNYEVQLALVRNPKTPTPIAARLVEYLRPNDLRDMAKGQGVRDEVKTVALRVYLRRTSQR